MSLKSWRACALVVTALTLSACDRPSEPVARAPAGATLAKGRPASVIGAADRLERQGAVEPAAPAPSPVSRRYLAVRHDLRIVTAPDAVEAAWKSAIAACVAAGCEVLASAVNHDDERQPASASLEARVPPAGLEDFLAKATALGTVGQRSTSAEDKTDEVIDTEAKQKNSIEFRDSLRRMLETPHARLKDLIDVERELTRVQSDIDSLASRRKALAGETEKAHVSLVFNARPSVIESGMWSPVRRAWLDAGHVLARSVATLLAAVVALLPWALVLLGVAAASRAHWRRRARRKPA